MTQPPMMFCKSSQQLHPTGLHAKPVGCMTYLHSGTELSVIAAQLTLRVRQSHSALLDGYIAEHISKYIVFRGNHPNPDPEEHIELTNS